MGLPAARDCLFRRWLLAYTARPAWLRACGQCHRRVCPRGLGFPYGASVRPCRRRRYTGCPGFRWRSAAVPRVPCGGFVLAGREGLFRSLRPRVRRLWRPRARRLICPRIPPLSRNRVLRPFRPWRAAAPEKIRMHDIEHHVLRAAARRARRALPAGVHDAGVSHEGPDGLALAFLVMKGSAAGARASQRPSILQFQQARQYVRAALQHHRARIALQRLQVITPVARSIPERRRDQGLDFPRDFGLDARRIFLRAPSGTGVASPSLAGARDSCIRWSQISSCTLRQRLDQSRKCSCSWTWPRAPTRW